MQILKGHSTVDLGQQSFMAPSIASTAFPSTLGPPPNGLRFPSTMSMGGAGVRVNLELNLMDYDAPLPRDGEDLIICIQYLIAPRRKSLLSSANSDHFLPIFLILSPAFEERNHVGLMANGRKAAPGSRCKLLVLVSRAEGLPLIQQTPPSTLVAASCTINQEGGNKGQVITKVFER